MKRTCTALVLFTLAGGAVACHPSKKELQAELDKVRGQLTDSQNHGKSLEQKIAELENEIAAQNKKIDELVEKQGLSEQELAELRAAQKEREAELATFKQLFAKLKNLVDAGTIKVVFRKGKMMVQLPSAVLFDSGKTNLKPNGLAALDEVTAALETVGDRDFMVVGHTDNVPIKTRRFKSNWELSTARAVVVVKHMIDKGFPAEHIGAAGYGEFDPVGDNSTEEGRAENRRIEIVLMPNLGELKGIENMFDEQK